MTCPVIKPDAIIPGDARDLLKCMDDKSVDLVVTSPPYWRDPRRVRYQEITPDGYKDWFMPIAADLKRVLKDTGSFVLNIRAPTINKEKHPVVFYIVTAMMHDGWQLRDEYHWIKSNPVPQTPRYKLKDGHESLFHFTKSDGFKFRPGSVAKDVDNCSASVSSPFDKKAIYDRSRFAKSNCKKAYPSNVLTIPVGGGTNYHPAQFPEKIPEFFIKLMSDKDDVVLDPFAGGGTTNAVAKKLCRKTIGFDLEKKFVTIANRRLKGVSCPGE